MIRNAEKRIKDSLEAISNYSDAIYILDDRSMDRTKEIAMNFSKVKNVFGADPNISDKDWYFKESEMINLLYRMADFYCPEWIIHLDDDEILEPNDQIRDILSNMGDNISGIKCPKISVWDDPDYPLMVPLMGAARQMSGAVWRHFSGLCADSKPLHNSRLPINIARYGKVISCEKIKFFHKGWNTLKKRILKVEKYYRLDPKCEYNEGVSYDKGLLFGYERNSINKLIRDYHLKYSEYLKIE